MIVDNLVKVCEIQQEMSKMAKKESSEGQSNEFKEFGFLQGWVKG